MASFYLGYDRLQRFDEERALAAYGAFLSSEADLRKMISQEEALGPKSRYSSDELQELQRELSPEDILSTGMKDYSSLLGYRLFIANNTDLPLSRSEKEKHEFIRVSALFQEAMKKGPLEPSFYVNFGIVLYAMGEEAQAMSAFQKAIRVGEQTKKKASSEWALKKGKIEIAIIDFQKEIRVQQEAGLMTPPGEAPGKGERNQGLGGLQRNIRIGESTGEAHFFLGTALLEQNKYDKAYLHLSKAEEILSADNPYKTPTSRLLQSLKDKPTQKRSIPSVAAPIKK